MSDPVPIVLECPSVEGMMVDWGIDIGKASYLLPRQRYSLASRHWVLGAFTEKWLELRKAWFSGFEEGAEVCFDYANLCACHARKCHRDTPWHIPGTALLVGPFGYIPRNAPANTGHVQVAFGIYEGGEKTWLLYEPQGNPGEVMIAKTEVNTCTYFVG